MKKLRLFCIIILPLWLQAQAIQVSEEITLRNDISYEIIGNMKGRVLLFRDRVTQFEVQAFDPQMKQVWSKELLLDKKQPKVLSVVSAQPDYFTVLYRFRHKNHLQLKAHIYDAAANLRDSITVKDYGFLFYTPNMEIVKSEDRSKIMVYYVENQQIFHLLVFDLISMSVLWEKSIILDGFNPWEELGQLLLDNDGNAYMIFEKNRFRVRKEGHYFEIFVLRLEEEQPRRIIAQMQEKITYDVAFAFDNLNQKLIATGLYAEKNVERASGVFFVSIPVYNPDSLRITFERFENEFLSNLLGKPVEDNRGLQEIAVQSIVLRRDGGALMILERNRQLNRQLGAANNRMFFDGAGRIIMDYYFDEMLLFSFHPDGKVHWKNILHKKQYSQDDDGVYSSFFLFKTPSNLRILYNDEIRLENTVSEYIITGNGEVERRSLLSTERLELRLRFRDAIQLSATELVVPSERRSRLRLVRLQYQ